jgi:hypothetical protein
MSSVGGTQGLCVLTYCRLHPRVMPRVANDRGGVAGVVAQRGGEVDRPCPAERADDEVAQPDPIYRALQAEQLAAPALLADAYAASVTAIVGVLTSLSAQIDAVHATLSKRFGQHPDAEILRSLPGLGVVLGARVLGEFGDDPNRYADAKARKNYAGTAPITRASGKRRTVLARFVRNRRLTDPLAWWAFCSLTCSPGARACYDRHRARGGYPSASPPCPGQPMGRHPARLPTPPSLLRRAHRLAAITPTTRWLTPTDRGMSTDLALQSSWEPGVLAAGYRLSRSRSLLVSRSSI